LYEVRHWPGLYETGDQMIVDGLTQKPAILRGVRKSNQQKVWVVAMVTRQRQMYAQMFEHWWVALSFALYIAKYPHVMTGEAYEPKSSQLS
jgi:hypothetical protein